MTDTLYDIDNGRLKYIGETKGGVPHGKGCELITDKSEEIMFFTGRFENGLRHGEGIGRDRGGLPQKCVYDKGKLICSQMILPWENEEKDNE